MKVLLPCLVIFTLHQAYGYIVDPGPVVIASRGKKNRIFFSENHIFD